MNAGLQEAAGVDSATPLPHFVQIEPVGQCNLRCQMCPIQFRDEGAPGQPRAFMDYEVYCKLIDQFPVADELQLQGLGEPLLHPRFFDMVRYAVARGIRVSTNTNMTVMSEQGAEECVRSGLHVMHVSLDGATAQTYQAIRVRSRFEQGAAQPAPPGGRPRPSAKHAARNPAGRGGDAQQPA